MECNLFSLSACHMTQAFFFYFSFCMICGTGSPSFKHEKHFKLDCVRVGRLHKSLFPALLLSACKLELCTVLMKFLPWILSSKIFQGPRRKWKWSSKNHGYRCCLMTLGMGLQVRDIVRLDTCCCSLQANGPQMNKKIHPEALYSAEMIFVNTQ